MHAGFDVNKVGDARVGFVGFPSVGKSTLLTKLTGTYSEVGWRWLEVPPSTHLFSHPPMHSQPAKPPFLLSHTTPHSTYSQPYQLLITTPGLLLCRPRRMSSQP